MYAYENIEMSLNYIEHHLREKIETGGNCLSFYILLPTLV